MCPLDDSHLTIEFDDHYVIKPTIIFFGNSGHDYMNNCLEETGCPVEQGFEYNSGTNPHFLSAEEICALNQLVEIE